jgi:hypothetical protein
MISYSDAETLAQSHLDRRSRLTRIPVKILHEHTISKPYGWVFFYQSHAWIETGDEKHQLMGNYPFLVDRFRAGIVPFGPLFKQDLARYEAALPPEELAVEAELPSRTA